MREYTEGASTAGGEGVAQRLRRTKAQIYSCLIAHAQIFIFLFGAKAFANVPSQSKGR
jgi:hypothetical protein